MVLTQQLCVACQRPEQQRKSTKRANSGSHLHHTPSKRCLPLMIPISARSIATTTWLTLLTSHRHLYPFFLFFFRTRCPTTLQVSDECELHKHLPLCVVPKTSMRNLFGRQEVQRMPSAPSVIKWRCLPCTSLITSC